MPLPSQLQAKLADLLQLGDLHLFQGLVYVPLQPQEQPWFGKRFCTFCRQRFADSRSEVSCRHSILNAAYHALQTGEPYYYSPCWLGLNSFALPIAPHGELVGAIGIGGFRYSGDQDDSAATVAKLHAFSQLDAQQATAQVHGLETISASRARLMALFVWDAVQAAGINRAAKVEVRHQTYLLQRRIAEQLQAYNREHPVAEDPVTLLPQFAAALRTGERETALQLLNEFCCRVLLTKSNHLGRMKMQFYLLASVLCKHQLGQQDDCLEVALQQLNQQFRVVVKAEHFEDICYWMYNQLEAFFAGTAGAGASALSERVLTWLRPRCTQNVTLSAAAAAVGACPSAVSKALARDTQRTFTQHLHQLRMTQAREQLLLSNRGIGEIAYACGYYDPSHFYRHFQREFGMGPRQFRRLGVKQPLTDSSARHGSPGPC